MNDIKTAREFKPGDRVRGTESGGLGTVVEHPAGDAENIPVRFDRSEAAVAFPQFEYLELIQSGPTPEDAGRTHDVTDAEQLAHAEDAERSAWTGYESIRDDIRRQNEQRLTSGPSIIRRVLDEIDKREPEPTLSGDPEAEPSEDLGMWPMPRNPKPCPHCGRVYKTRNGMFERLQAKHADPEPKPAVQRCTSRFKGMQCDMPVHEGLHGEGEEGYTWNDHGVLIEATRWDDERHIWVTEHMPELSDGAETDGTPQTDIETAGTSESEPVNRSHKRAPYIYTSPVLAAADHLIKEAEHTGLVDRDIRTGLSIALDEAHTDILAILKRGGDPGQQLELIRLAIIGTDPDHKP